MKKLILSILTVILLSGCSDKSGSSYEDWVLEGLKERYNEEFIVVDRLGENANGYTELVISPVRDANIKFYADAETPVSTGMPFGVNKKLYDSYLQGVFYSYAPKVYGEVFGFSPPLSYYTDNMQYGAKQSKNDNPYAIVGITEDNIEEAASKLKEAMDEIFSHLPGTRYIPDYSDGLLRVPIQFMEMESKDLLAGLEFNLNEPIPTYEEIESDLRVYRKTYVRN